MKIQNEKSGVSILIVEDSRTQAEYLRHILENEGYRVVIAADGREALDQIGIDRPSIVLTDIVMPEMDGYELCRTIKQNGNLAHIPVILVTQLFDPADLIKGLEAGADNIIIKPFEPQHVISRITSTLQSQPHPDSDEAEPMLEVSLDGKTHYIPASQLQTPAILLSTYDHVLRKNTELQEANERLAAVNENLQKRVDCIQHSDEKIPASLNNGINGTDHLFPGPDSAETEDQTTKIREIEERFRMMTELFPFPISLMDSSGSYRFLNKKFTQIFGYTLEDIPTENDWISKAFRTSAEPKNQIRAWKQNLEGAGNGFSQKFSLTSKDGAVHQVSIHPILLTRDEQYIVYVDLTYKTESDRLRSILASIVNSSNDAIIGKTIDGIILSWNRAAERYYGYLAEEVIGKSIEIIIPPELRVHLPLFLQRVRNGETIDRFDTIRLRKDGSRIEVSVTLSPIKDDEGHIIGISTIAQNIAERKKYEVSRMFNQQVLHRR